MGKPRGLPVKPDVLAKEAQVVALRREGNTWDAIAKIVGYKDPSGAYDAYTRAAKRAVREDVDAIRDVEAERLDLLQTAVWQQAMIGDVPSGMQVLRIMERRAKLLGLDQPVRIQAEVISYDADNIDSEVARLVQLLNTSGQPNSSQTSEMGTDTSTTKPTTT